jgi:hypothetical protein
VSSELEILRTNIAACGQRIQKLGAIKSAEDFGSAAILRNKFSHHYPEEADLRIERLKLVIDEAEFVIATFGDINGFLLRKGFATVPS